MIEKSNNLETDLNYPDYLEIFFKVLRVSSIQYYMEKIGPLNTGTNAFNFRDLSGIEVSRADLKIITDFLKQFIKNKKTSNTAEFFEKASSNKKMFYFNAAEVILHKIPDEIDSAKKFDKYFKTKEGKESIKYIFRVFSYSCRNVMLLYSNHKNLSDEKFKQLMLILSVIDREVNKFEIIFSGYMKEALDAINKRNNVIDEVYDQLRERYGDLITKEKVKEVISKESMENAPFKLLNKQKVAFLEEDITNSSMLIERIKITLSMAGEFIRNSSNLRLYDPILKFEHKGELKPLGMVLNEILLEKLNILFLENPDECAKAILALRETQWFSISVDTQNDKTKDRLNYYYKALLALSDKSFAKGFDILKCCIFLVNEKSDDFTLFNESVLSAFIKHVSLIVPIEVFQPIVIKSMRKFPSNKSFMECLKHRKSYDAKKIESDKKAEEAEREKRKEIIKQYSSNESERKIAERAKSDEERKDEVLEAAKRRELKQQIADEKSSLATNSDDDSEIIRPKNIFDKNAKWITGSGDEVNSSSGSIFKIGFDSNITFKAYLEIPQNIREQLPPSLFLDERYVKLASSAVGDSGVKFNAPTPFVAEIKFLGSLGDVRVYFSQKIESKEFGVLYTGAQIGSH